MTIFWVNALPALQGVLTSLAIDGADPLWSEQGAEWKNQAHAFVSPDTAVQIDLKIFSSADGEWETRYEPDVSDPTQQRAIFTGFRQFVLQVQCKAYEADFARMALTYAERIRTNLQRNSTVDALRLLGLHFYKYGPINDVPGVEDGHALTVADLSLFGYADFSDDPTAAELVSTFTSITLTSKVTGYTPGVPPNFTDTFSSTDVLSNE